MIAALMNRLWLLSGYREYLSFERNAHRIEAVQRSKLSELLYNNSNTAFGKAYHFARISNYEQYAHTVPLLEDYKSFAPYIQEIAAGKADVLFPGKPKFFETTSGSTGTSKLIPYNAALKSEMESGIQVWMHNLYRQDQAIFNGPAYWSVSPAVKKKAVPNGNIPTGSSGDTDYFNPFTAWLLKHMLVSAPGQNEYDNSHSFYVKIWRNLLSAPELRFISVWSPNYLIRLHQFLAANHIEILKGTSLPKIRKQTLSKLFSDSFTMHDVFPKLRLLSCWTQAQAEMWLPELREILGNVKIQGKGLLSTEGLVTIPYGENMHVLAYTGHFFEFKEKASGNVCASWQLEKGQVYEVILTTGAGLYRHCTGDLVRCSGLLNAIPCLEFLGRGNAVCDLVGEKLYESSLPTIFFAARAKSAIYADKQSFLSITKNKNKPQHPHIQPLKMFLYAWKEEENAGYKLLLEGESNTVEVAEIVEHVSSSLEENPYYAQALAAGQLAPLTAEIYPLGFSGRLFEWYGNTRQMKDGDIKLPLLYKPGELKGLIGY